MQPHRLKTIATLFKLVFEIFLPNVLLNFGATRSLHQNIIDLHIHIDYLSPMRKILTLIFILVIITSSQAQTDIIGKWKSVDDESREAKSIVEIYVLEGKINGKILKTFPKEGDDPDPICDECDEDDPRYKQKIIGMEIIQKMEKDGDEYSGGKILDPENGNIYRCKIWREKNKLYVRGYLGFFYRTQEWLIVE